jgi:cell division protein FtsI/penicillin-binding protein 2
LGGARLDAVFRAFGLYDPPALALPTTAAVSTSIADPALAAVGQAELTVTPLHIALATAAIARGGAMPAPQLVLATESPGGAWQREPPPAPPAPPLTASSAAYVKDLLANGYTATALTSTEGQTLAWFTGFAPFEPSRYAVAVLLEAGDTAAAAHIGRALLDAAQAP